MAEPYYVVERGAACPLSCCFSLSPRGSWLLLLQRECKDCSGEGCYRGGNPFLPVNLKKFFIKSRVYQLLYTCIGLMNSEP